MNIPLAHLIRKIYLISQATIRAAHQRAALMIQSIMRRKPSTTKLVTHQFSSTHESTVCESLAEEGVPLPRPTQSGVGVESSEFLIF